jgi:hypothetical protein
VHHVTHARTHLLDEQHAISLAYERVLQQAEAIAHVATELKLLERERERDRVLAPRVERRKVEVVGALSVRAVTCCTYACTQARTTHRQSRVAARQEALRVGERDRRRWTLDAVVLGLGGCACVSGVLRHSMHSQHMAHTRTRTLTRRSRMSRDMTSDRAAWHARRKMRHSLCAIASYSGFSKNRY